MLKNNYSGILMEISNLSDNFSKLLSGRYDRDNAGDAIFDNLNGILHFSNACLFYINGELLNPIYTRNFPDTNAKCDKISGLKKFSMKETLYVNSCPFAVLVISDDSPYSKDEERLFKICSLIIANILKDIEVSDIMKMQVKALQDGIIEINGFNKIIKEQNKKIIEADKVKNKFLSNISHELRSPLNSIIGFSDLLISETFGKLNEKQIEYINDIQTAGIHLLGMVNEILDISKIESHCVTLNRTKFDVHLCASEVLNILKPLYIKKQINVENLIPPKTFIFADYQKLQQIFFNLMSNAIKFTGENGNIKLSSKVTQKYVILSISDDGIGIAAENHARIFKKFEQINNENSVTPNSTGLGLTITKELVKLHGGQIKLESELNKGSVFYIKLPACQD